ncbi:MAG: phosphoserine phosphatase SerB [Candidatus Hecatellaceae archaeon]
MPGKIIVTVIGGDRPGIVAEISRILYKHKANILKTRASALGSLFVMVMLVDTSGADVPADWIKEEVKEAGIKLNLGVSVEDAETFMRKKKLVAFDMDGTLVENETIDELAKAAGVYDKVKQITREAMEGKISFKKALAKRVKLLKGLPVEEVEKVKSRIKISPGAEDLIGELKKAGFVTAIITGGFDVFANYVAETLGIDYVYANRLKVKDGKLTGEFEGVILSPQDKLKALKEISERENIPLDECVAIGDGANDIILLKSSGLGIGYNPKEPIRRHADGLVQNLDLRTLLALIGVSQASRDVARRLKGNL